MKKRWQIQESLLNLEKLNIGMNGIFTLRHIQYFRKALLLRKEYANI